jgi:hypothetical protein
MMKKFFLVALATATVLATAMPANAALTTALPDGEVLWVMPVGHPVPGEFRSLDPATGEFSDVFVGTSTVSSDSWIVGADYDPATDSVYWIKDFGDPTESIVRYNVSDNVETVFQVIDAADYDIRGIDVTDGVLRISAYLMSNGNAAVATVTLDDAAETATLGTVRDLGGNVNQGAIAIDPTTDDLYLMTYECQVYRVNGDDTLTSIDFLDNYLTVTSDCIALDFDSSGRAWATTGETGRTASFVPADISGSIEASEWSQPSWSIYGEAIFIKGVAAPVDNNALASTGFNASSLAPLALAILGAGAIVVARRRKA